MSLDSLYGKLTEPKLTKKCILAALLIFIPGLIIAIIIAHFFGPEMYIPPLYKLINNPESLRLNRYTIWSNWISDLGSFRFTPAPFILDIMLMSIGLLMIPVFFYLYTKLLPAPSKIALFDRETKSGKLYAKITIVWLIIGAIGAFGAGLFSEDRSYFGLHGFFSIVVFGGFAVGALLSAFIFIYKETFIPRIFGIIILCSPIASLLFVINPFNNLYILEWIMMFAIFAWIIPIALIILKEVENDLK
ncbi:MAG: DUF998 domain-containing protein [Candidatus Helarchaeota archaeon]